MKAASNPSFEKLFCSAHFFVEAVAPPCLPAGRELYSNKKVFLKKLVS
jgi:hypothetical protein